MARKNQKFQIIDLSKKAYLMPDAYLNGWAKHCGWKATLVFNSLCRHADRQAEAFPSAKLMAKEFGVSEKTIYRGIKTLEDWSIIKKKQKRGKEGKFLHNTYFILSKKDWKEPPTDSTGKRATDGLYRQPTDSTDNDRRTVSPTKDTHTKDTHNTIHSIGENSDSSKEKKNSKEKEYGKPEINSLLKEIKETLDIEKFSDTTTWTRRYAHNCLRDYGKQKTMRAVQWMVDEWPHKPLTMKKVYYGTQRFKEQQKEQKIKIPEYAKGRKPSRD